MSLVPRVVRNLWHRDADDGAHVKYVDDEGAYVDAVDVTENLEENMAVSAATWEDDDSTLTLGTPSIAAGVVQFTHVGVGYAVLKLTMDFAAYVASLFTRYLGTSYSMVPSTAGGVGGVAGDPAVFTFLDSLTNPVTGMSGKAVRLVMPSGNVVVMSDLAWNIGGYYDATLASSFDVADESDPADIGDMFSEYDDISTHDDYAARPTKIVRVPMRFADPTREEDDYS